MQVVSASAPNSSHGTERIEPFAAVCIVGQIRAHGDNATRHWELQRSFLQSLMLGEAWQGLHVIIVSGSEELKATGAHLPNAFGLPEENVHSIRMGRNATRTLVNHCPVLADGRLPVNCSEATMAFCAQHFEPGVTNYSHEEPRQQTACALCFDAGITESREHTFVPRSRPLTIGPELPETGSAGPDGTAWLIREKADLLPTVAGPGLPSALRAFYSQWDKTKACVQRVRKIEMERGARFKFVVKTRTDWPFVRGPALSSLQNPTIVYTRYRCAVTLPEILPRLGFLATNLHWSSASNANCPKQLTLLDDMFVVAPRGGGWDAYTPSDALGAVADLPCPVTDKGVQEMIAGICARKIWAECLWYVALRASRVKGRSGPIMVTWGDASPFGRPHEQILPATYVDPLTGLPAAGRLPVVRVRGGCTQSSCTPIRLKEPPRCQRCTDNGRLHCCGVEGCTETVSCKSNKGLSACACPAFVSDPTPGLHEST